MTDKEENMPETPQEQPEDTVQKDQEQEVPHLPEDTSEKGKDQVVSQPPKEVSEEADVLKVPQQAAPAEDAPKPSGEQKQPEPELKTEEPVAEKSVELPGSEDKGAGEPVDSAEQEVEQEADEEPEKPNKDVIWVECGKEMVNRDCRQLLETLGMTLVPFRVTERYGESLADQWKKIEHVKFAVVCLWGDEFCYDKEGKPADSRLCSSPDKVFALGFLLAKLGRMNVFVLYYEQRTFMIPTDMQEVVYVPYNRTGAWQDLLKSRLKMVGMLE